MSAYEAAPAAGSTAAVPTHWYNIAADFPEPIPPHLHPGTKEPVTVEDLCGLFPRALAEQELSTERYIQIPREVRSVYGIWRGTPLIRASRLERALGTASQIFLKYEGVSPVGSHKPNSAVAQAYYNREEAITKLTTETGAGQWGSSLAFAGSLFGIDVEVWQVRASYESKPYRRYLMELYGGTVHSSPSELTEAGRAILESDSETTGSLGMAVSEAVEVALKDPAARYALGSVLNHVALHQTVIGQETIAQLARLGIGHADVVFGCAGGGSNLAGLSFPFLREVLMNKAKTRVIAAEPAACPSLTQGEYRYDFGDFSGMTPLLKMYTLGKDFVPDPIHAGGLRYHGMAPALSHAVHLGLVDAVAIEQTTAFHAGILLARTEGIVPAPESTHALAAAFQYLAHSDRAETIVIGVSGHGQLDLPSYQGFLESYQPPVG
ncbi:TrpB-like pyridoxal phosphate-dependent enzyme [Rarobacter incanus]|uniref:tryptophan synthase n=1 Tax=Rarobacter incanus TaxID=153494 RepID=A0A542SMH0_9MICO|nr:TrpB-like pyridoxal phosphate-dependent enzyme [Rarobacter incanus]TQK75447.1 tryptophan synthase beta chain [Rarobacter incanus]